MADPNLIEAIEQIAFVISLQSVALTIILLAIVIVIRRK